jgi:phosphoglycolate phosphatase-like HAD superfamily hydrolase
MRFADLDAVTLSAAMALATDRSQVRLVDGADAALESLRARGLEVAIIGDHEIHLDEYLDQLGIAQLVSITVDGQTTQGDALLEALDQLRVSPERALHVGSEPADEQAASTAGMHFCSGPLTTVVRSLQ